MEFRATSNCFKSFLHLLDVQTSILDVQRHYKQTETFEYMNFYLCHPPGVKKGFIKGEALRLLRTNSSYSMLNKNMQSFKTRLKNRGYPNEFLEKHAFEVNFKDRKWSLENKGTQKHKKENIACCNTIPPGFT